MTGGAYDKAGKKWTDADDERLRRLAAAGRHKHEIAAMMHRTPIGVGSRASTLKVPLQRPVVRTNFRPWGEDEDQRLRDMIAAGKGRHHCARVLCRWDVTVIRRAIELGTPFPPVNRNALWTDEFLAQAVAEWKDGASGNQIAVRLGRGLTRSAVIAKMHRLGLGNIPGRYKPRKAQPKQAKAKAPRPPRIERAPRVRPSRSSSGFALRPLGIKHPSALPARPLPPAQPTTDIARVRLDELKSRHCRWIVGDPKRIAAGQPVFCGARREQGLPYCRDHNARAYHEVSAAPRQHYGEGGARVSKPRLQ